MVQPVAYNVSFLHVLRLLPAILINQHSSDIKKTYPMFISVIPYATQHGLPSSRSSQGKVAELRQELHSGGKKDKNYSAKKIALKKIVANMTMSNNDMVALFPDVIECMNLPSLEIKKMYVRTKSGTCYGEQRSLILLRSVTGAFFSWSTTRE